MIVAEDWLVGSDWSITSRCSHGWRAADAGGVVSLHTVSVHQCGHQWGGVYTAASRGACTYWLSYCPSLLFSGSQWCKVVSLTFSKANYYWNEPLLTSQQERNTRNIEWTVWHHEVQMELLQMTSSVTFAPLNTVTEDARISK